MTNCYNMFYKQLGNEQLEIEGFFIQGAAFIYIFLISTKVLLSEQLVLGPINKKGEIIIVPSKNPRPPAYRNSPSFYAS